MLSTLKEDIKTIYENDPAAKSTLEIIFCYAGFQALVLHRLAHKLLSWKIPFIPRFISYLARFLTGVDIHPGAQIGRRCFIDHGTGVVIGETSIVGQDVLIYQQVTLGGTGCEHGKRHPTIGDGVILGAGAKVLGNITIGAHTRIGAGSVVVHNVPANCTVVGVPGRVVRQKVMGHDGILMHNKIPDPVKAELEKLRREVAQLKEKIK
jgi:serine O-acetyltransferase